MTKAILFLISILLILAFQVPGQYKEVHMADIGVFIVGFFLGCLAGRL